MSTESNIVTQLAAAVAARKDSLIALRQRIAALLGPIPTGVVLEDDQGEVCRIIRICTGASQWGNRTWDVTIRGTGVLSPAGKLICEDLDDSYFDGNNLHTRSSEPTCRYSHGEPGEALAFEPGTETRKYAARLPAAVARYMAHCAAEVDANKATLTD